MTRYFRHTTIKLIAAFFLTAASISCHSSRNVSTGQSNSRDQWHDVSVPVKVAIESPMGMSFSGKATMVRDSAINISMSVFGFEVATLQMNADSVCFTDKHNKYYFAETLRDVLGSHKLTIGEIQQMILGAGGQKELSFNNPDARKPVTIKFTDYADTPFGRMASDIDVDAPVKGINLQANMQWKFNSAKWDSYPQIKFKTPSSKYKRITADQIRRMFSER